IPDRYFVVLVEKTSQGREPKRWEERVLDGAEERAGGLGQGGENHLYPHEQLTSWPICHSQRGTLPVGFALRSTIHRARRPHMTSAEIRQRFLNFFKERDHKVLPSSSLIPFGDPTLLFTSAGMVPFKPYFLGQPKPPHPRATTVQKVFRSSDIDVVGQDGHHLTFFEMLGNFSFGDYFKEKAIPYAYELLTKELGLEPGRLWAGIHNEDDESDEIWKKTGIPPARIRRFGDEYNFWAAGLTGPCGPDSEVHYDWGEEHGCRLPDCGPNCEHPGCDRFLEIWNLVFIQWDRDQA